MAALSALGWYHLAVFGVVVPLGVIRSRRKLTGPKPAPLDRLRHLRSTTIMLVLFGGFSLFTARDQGLRLFDADAGRIAGAAPAALAMYAAAVFFMYPRWRRAVERRVRIVHLFMPSNGTERAWWLIVSLLAGVSEEISWRGVQTTLLAVAMHDAIAGAVLCAVMFGVAHVVQGWKSGVIIAFFALGFQGLVWLSGSLYLAMAVHAAYDITAGLTYGRLGRQLGYELADGRGLSSSPPHASGSPL